MTNTPTEATPGKGESLPFAPSAPPTTSERSTASTKEYAHPVAAEGGHSASETISAAATSAWDKMVAAATFVGDLNNDGKVDEEDAKIAAAKLKAWGSTAADVAGDVAKDMAKNEMVKDAAAGAAIGAIVAVPIPLVGPVLGAAVGAAAGVLKSVLSSIKFK